MYRVSFTIILFFYSFVHGQCPFGSERKKKTQKNIILPIRKTNPKSFFFGDYSELKEGVMPFFSKLQREYSDPIIQFTFPFSGILFPHFNIIFDPQLAKQILYDEDNFIKGEAIEPFRKLFAPEGITFMETSKRWKTLHAVLQEKPFNPRYFPERYAALFNDHFQELFCSWQKKYSDTPFDLYQEMTHLTMGVIAQAFFNYRMSKGELAVIVPAFKYILDFIQSREMEIIKIPTWISTEKNKIFCQSVTLLNRFYKTLIAHDPVTVTTKNTQFKTIITLLKEYTDPDTHERLDENKIVSHIGTLFFAGHDTTANLITMALYQLHNNPSLREAIVNEIHTTHKDTVPSYITMGTLPTLDLFLQEVLRLYPSAPIITRQAIRDVHVRNYLLTEKSIVIIPISHINRHPDYFTNPLHFNPYRFVQTNDDYKKQSDYAFIPFSVGSRRCLGQWFALAQARSFIVQLLTSNIQLLLATENNTPVDLEMKSTGLPNQKIYGLIQTKKSRFETRENTSNNIQELEMQVIDKRYENEAHTIITLRLQPKDNSLIPSFALGDYITLYINKENTPLSARHYSISSSVYEKSWIEITVKKEALGIGSEYIHNTLAINDIVTVRMPLHEATLLPKNLSTPIVLISGGIGITPMMSIVRSLIDTRWTGDIYFIHASKSGNLLPFKNELQEWNATHQNIHQLLTLTQEPTPSEWDGLRGRFSVNDITSFVGTDITDASIVICGTQHMTQGITHDLLQSACVQKKNIHTLSFGSLEQTTVQTNITPEEVAMHNTPDDAWIIIDNKVFDITSYITKHPGFDVISDYIGTDATEAFYSVAHSGNAQRDMTEHPNIIFVGYIGNYPLSTVSNNP